MSRTGTVLTRVDADAGSRQAILRLAGAQVERQPSGSVTLRRITIGDSHHVWRHANFSSLWIKAVTWVGRTHYLANQSILVVGRPAADTSGQVTSQSLSALLRNERAVRMDENVYFGRAPKYAGLPPAQ